ncbi:MAG: dihydrofolate reductase, partial [Actinomyces sp.]|nr:dihydrofolate reductase [Actinomyces sp.]
QKDAALRGSERVWVTGGAQIYSLAMDVVDELVVSVLELKEEAQARVGSCTSGVYAPEIDPSTWKLDTEASDAQWRGPSGDALRWRIQVFRRI